MKRTTLFSIVLALAPIGIAAAQAPRSDLAVGPSVLAPPPSFARETMTVGPAPRYHAPSIVQQTPAQKEAPYRVIVGLLAGAVILGYTTNATKAYDRDQFFATRAVNDMVNRIQFDNWYQARNHGGTVAPGAAKGGNSVAVKTTNNTTYVRGGVPRALAASDNFWDLTTAAQGVGVVPISSFIKYRLIATAAEAAKVQSSTIGVAANGTDCSFGAQPLADGDLVLAILLVATDNAHTFTPGTTHLDAAGITATYTDGSDCSEFQSAQFTY